jgi:hypothetical protein
VLSIHFRCAAVSAARGLNGPARGDDGAGRGVGDGRGGMDAATVDGVGLQEIELTSDASEARTRNVLARSGCWAMW